MAVAWRIGVDAPAYLADDLSGKGAELTGGRWNHPGTPLIHGSESVALAFLETLVHLSGHPSLPFNRYLVRIDIPARAWRKRQRFGPAANVGWQAEPPGAVSMDWGTRWAQAGTQLVAIVPSVIVPEEHDLLINPRHPESTGLVATKLRRWTYDPRLR